MNTLSHFSLWCVGRLAPNSQSPYNFVSSSIPKKLYPQRANECRVMRVQTNENRPLWTPPGPPKITGFRWFLRDPLSVSHQTRPSLITISPLGVHQISAPSRKSAKNGRGARLCGDTAVQRRSAADKQHRMSRLSQISLCHAVRLPNKIMKLWQHIPSTSPPNLSASAQTSQEWWASNCIKTPV